MRENARPHGLHFCLPSENAHPRGVCFCSPTRALKSPPQALLASAVGHSVGIAVGLTTTATAIPLLLKSTHNLPPALSNARQIACSILRDARVARATGIVCKSTAVFAGLLTLVRIFGSDMFAKGPLGIGFPDMCPPGYEIGCTRVAVTNGNSPMRPLVIQVQPKHSDFCRVKLSYMHPF